MKFNYKILLGALVVLASASSVQARTYYVSNNGTASNTGNDFNNSITFLSAYDRVSAGDTILMKSETYSVPYNSGFSEGNSNTIFLSKSGTQGNEIVITSEEGKKTIIDFSFPEGEWVQNSFGFDITGDYWYFKNIDITRAGYQGVYVKGAHNTFDNCAFYDNRNTGLEINKGGSYTLVLNCDAYRNFDPKKNGSMADGFGPKQEQGPGNTFIGCRAWENSDDGYDCFDSEEEVIFKDCWAFRNGINVWGYSTFEGNGNGFKVGGNHVPANNNLTRCVAFGHPAKGFDQNNNTGGLTLLNCTGYDNGDNYGLGGTLNSGEQHYLRNCISLGGSQTISNADHSFNTWNTNFSVSNSDFVSLNTDLATIARDSDGNIPATDLFRLKEGSALIDAGTNVGLDFSGDAPDLGAFEFDQNKDCNGDENGSAYYDDCGVCVSGNTGKEACTGVMQAETPCTIDGVELESNNTGYWGEGYVNTDNVLGASVSWILSSDYTQDIDLSMRFANGGSTARDGEVFVNGVSEGNISLPSTGAWTSWEESTVNISLNSGLNEIEVVAISDDGLANIDALFLADGVEDALCSPILSSSADVQEILFIYPNPVSAVLNISEPSEWVLENATRQLLKSGSGTQINVSDLEEGFYLLVLDNTVLQVIKN